MAKKSRKLRVIVLHGPNLNFLGKRDQAVYGSKTLDSINKSIEEHAAALGIEVATYQSNSEGSLVDFIQAEASGSGAIVINPGALTHYGLSLRDALQDTGLPVIEVHLSNIYAREQWRATSVIAPIARGQISGLGWRGYVAALDILAAD
ncbi:MAG: type II 3-dehydroquinate dehydratase [Chloroflexi bacterium]|nr:type II 3-dehydroquinate dehydratase [Chloroflexota bacterium]